MSPALVSADAGLVLLRLGPQCGSLVLCNMAARSATGAAGILPCTPTDHKTILSCSLTCSATCLPSAHKYGCRSKQHSQLSCCPVLPGLGLQHPQPEAWVVQAAQRSGGAAAEEAGPRRG